jgi:hypothetical protein
VLLILVELLTITVQEEFEDTKGGNQNPYMAEEQTTLWPKEKVQKDKKSLKIPKE